MKNTGKPRSTKSRGWFSDFGLFRCLITYLMWRGRYCVLCLWIYMCVCEHSVDPYFYGCFTHCSNCLQLCMFHLILPASPFSFMHLELSHSDGNWHITSVALYIIQYIAVFTVLACSVLISALSTHMIHINLNMIF